MVESICERDENKLFKLYTLAELSYKKHFEKILGEVDYLFPVGWYEKRNYKEKIEIISEAIKTNTLIVNTELYQKTIERVETDVKNFIKEK